MNCISFLEQNYNGTFLKWLLMGHAILFKFTWQHRIVMLCQVVHSRHCKSPDKHWTPSLDNGTFLWDDLDQISDPRYSSHVRLNEPMNPLWTRIHWFLWSTMIRVISDHPKGMHPKIPRWNQKLVHAKEAIMLESETSIMFSKYVLAYSDT